MTNSVKNQVFDNIVYRIACQRYKPMITNFKNKAENYFREETERKVECLERNDEKYNWFHASMISSYKTNLEKMNSNFFLWEGKGLNNKLQEEYNQLVSNIYELTEKYIYKKLFVE